MTDIVCIDTQILSWAIVEHITRGAEQIAPRAKPFLAWVEQQKFQVVVPSIVVGELLIPVDDNDLTDAIGRFRQDWIIADFDVRAAIRFSRMRRNHIFDNRLKWLQEQGGTRKALIADGMIISTAVAFGCKRIYTHNANLIHLADGHIEAIDFLNVPIQGTLFEDEG